MTPAEITDQEMAIVAKDLRDKGTPFAIATVVRTLGATAAKPGTKALLTADGCIQQGWIGGGCVRSAVTKAVNRAIQDRAPQFISLRPQELLIEKDIQAGDEVEGIRFDRNGCPSKGSLDIFVEPVLPLPELLIFGTSPVAQSLAKLSEQFQWSIQPCKFDTAVAPLTDGCRRMIVVSTQGKGDLACLTSALNAEAEFIAFVGSQKKFTVLSDKLVQAGFPLEQIAKVQAPAGLTIDAVTSEEIALSILAQLTQIRRANQRHGGS